MAAAASGAVAFSYARFWNWWRGDEGGALEATDDVIVRVCDADYHAMKYKKGAVAPFLTRNMAAFRVTDASLLAARDRLFANGLFMVMERAALSDAVRSRLPPDHQPPSERSHHARERERENALRKKWLFAVCPRLHERGAPGGEDGGGALLAGDHFSFVIGSAGDEPLHLHWTEYVPHTVHGAALGMGDDRRTKNPLPLDFHIPRGVAAFRAALLVPRLRHDHHSAPLHRILRRPFEAALPPRQARLDGGGGPGAGRRRAQRHAQTRVAGSPRAFDDLWHELPLRRLVIVGARRGAGYDFIVTIHDRLAHEIGVLRPSATFRLSAAAAWDDDEVYKGVARAMADLTWASFTDPPPMPGEEEDDDA